MTLRTLIARSLRFHWRTHLGVVLGAAVGSAALVGALVVGDSARESLRQQALQRLGNIHFALAPTDRLFRTRLADDFERLYTGFSQGSFFGGQFVPVLRLEATATRADGAARANRVQVLGVDQRFAKLAADDRFAQLGPDSAILNEALAIQLGVRKGDTVVLRVRKPSALSSEAPIAPVSDATAVLRVQVQDLAPASAMGNFGLTPSQVAPFNAFVSLEGLQAAVGATNRANLIVVSSWRGALPQPATAWERATLHLKQMLGLAHPAEPTGWLVTSTGMVRAVTERGPLSLELLNQVPIFQRVWQLQDAELELRQLLHVGSVELGSSRIFLDPVIEKAALTSTPGLLLTQMMPSAPQQSQEPAPDSGLRLALTDGRPILTYLANLIRAGTNTTPYSMVTAAGPPWTPEEMGDDEIVVNQWLADDLQVRPGDVIELTYFLPESGARLVEATNRFRVRGIVPMSLPWADRTLMPEFPGIARAERTHDWDAGFPLVHKIRDKDEHYWKQYRGTPKAFLTLAAGQKLWANRFGNLTAIRWFVPTNTTAQTLAGLIETNLLRNLNPAEVGLRFEPVREQALRAVNQAQDFGQLFLGFSFFLIAAALILMALLFQLGLEQRTEEVGTLLALGFSGGRVRRLFLGEGVALAALGGLLGCVGGLGYARAMLEGLATVWREAVHAATLGFHVSAPSLAAGGTASVALSAVVLGMTLRKLARQPAPVLLAGAAELECQSSNPQSRIWNLKSRQPRRALGLGVAALAGALGLAGWALLTRQTAAAGVFFGAGTLVLVAALGFAAGGLTALAPTEASRRLSLGALGLRGVTRRHRRSLAVVGLLACGSFVITAISAFKQDPHREVWRHSSGTGGFALMGESTLPIVRDLNSREGREFYGLDEATMAGVSFVPLRVREGDDASCLNLNRAQRPRLLGVNPELLAGRFTFAQGPGWASLKSEAAQVPALGDAASIRWALGKRVGETVEGVDERGQPFRLRLVGALAGSILQGSLILDEAQFTQLFPKESGYRMFLIDAPRNRVEEVAAALSRAFQDVGLELTPAARRLAQLNAVQNTYLNTFQVLGGLGLALGSAGLGVVVLRNALERRAELGLLVAVGFRRRRLQALVLSEHAALLGLGLIAGVGAAGIAITPTVLAPGTPLPWATLAFTLAGLLVSGMLWTWLATRLALRGRLVDALRNE